MPSRTQSKGKKQIMQEEEPEASYHSGDLVFFTRKSGDSCLGKVLSSTKKQVKVNTLEKKNHDHKFSYFQQKADSFLTVEIFRIDTKFKRSTCSS